VAWYGLSGKRSDCVRGAAPHASCIPWASTAQSIMHHGRLTDAAWGSGGWCACGVGFVGWGVNALGWCPVQGGRTFPFHLSCSSPITKMLDTTTRKHDQCGLRVESPGLVRETGYRYHTMK